MKRKLSKPQGKSGHRISLPEQPESPENKRPIFCFQYMDASFGIKECEKDDKAEILNTLHYLSQQIWRELKQKAKDQKGFTAIPQFQIKRPIPPHITPDTSILKVRYKDAKTLVGYQKGVVFHIVWIDSKYKLYDHG